MGFNAVVLKVFDRAIEPEMLYVSWDEKFGRRFGQCDVGCVYHGCGSIRSSSVLWKGLMFANGF